ncbi:MAG: phosphatidylglycerol lysyltransferase domain-containing protein [Candidatus Omnitrophica bacterium]|nr:phosphatidylglycerol lysyltransferase domain-containing protein [Candidatus Omnitrophota bacterium]MCM8800270.1 phosphatidylglycerol lysyltransferase domain-containing protein [Candidatus Omnitrophota bacterium]
MLKELSIEDKQIFEKFINLKRHQLSSYQFSNIFIWGSLYKILWQIIDGSLCVFFKDDSGCFMYIAPLAKEISSDIIKSCFQIMDRYNKNKSISRIENVESSEVNFYRSIGYNVEEKYPDYLCLRKELVELKGNRFKAKRANINYFMKNYHFSCRNFSLKYKGSCLELYRFWMQERLRRYKDRVYQSMLEDNFKVLKFLFNFYNDLDFTGWVVEIDSKVKAFSLGYPLNKDTFCILYEIADLKIKGLAQFIFWYFCQQLSSYKYINIMDDSGLENLRRTKLSYHPEKISNYIVK